MFFIGICDDEESFRIDIKQKCETYCKEIGVDCTCLLFESLEQLLRIPEALERNTEHDLAGRIV